MKTILIALAAGLLTVTAQAQQNSEQVNDIVFLVNNSLTTEQQALMENGKWMQMYSPGEHSRCFTTQINATRHGKTGAVHEIENPESVLLVVFGVEDATPARNQGKEMAQNRYSAAQADKFLFAKGYEKYHGNRFFTRAYVQEGQDSFDRTTGKAVRSHALPDGAVSVNVPPR